MNFKSAPEMKNIHENFTRNTRITNSIRMKAIKTFGIAIISIAFSSGAFAQLTAYANIYAEIVSPAVIEKSADLTFSQVSSSQDGSSMVLGAADAAVGSSAEPAQAVNGTLAAFSFAAGDFSTIDVSLPVEDITLRNSGSGSLSIGDFTKSSSLAMVSGANSRVIRVGATLRSNDKQPSGNYADQSSFLVTFNYN